MHDKVTFVPMAFPGPFEHLLPITEKTRLGWLVNNRLMSLEYRLIQSFTASNISETDRLPQVSTLVILLSVKPMQSSPVPGRPPLVG